MASSWVSLWSSFSNHVSSLLLSIEWWCHFFVDIFTIGFTPSLASTSMASRTSNHFSNVTILPSSLGFGIAPDLRFSGSMLWDGNPTSIRSCVSAQKNDSMMLKVRFHPKNINWTIWIVVNVNPGLISHGLLIRGESPNSHDLILKWYPPIKQLRGLLLWDYDVLKQYTIRYYGILWMLLPQRKST